MVATGTGDADDPAPNPTISACVPTYNNSVTLGCCH